MARLILVSVLLLQLLLFCGAEFGLSPYFYYYTCPDLEYIVRDVVRRAVAEEPRMGASLLRLHFHDCFVDGCESSITLDDSESIRSEKNAPPNLNSVRGFDVIDTAKAGVEKFCPGVVSCADILALAAREGVLALQGPYWRVYYGRRDSLTANFEAAGRDLPSPNSTLEELIQKFSSKGLSPEEMITLSGGHSIGKARCGLFKDRLSDFGGSGKPDPTMNVYYLKKLQEACKNDSTAVELDDQSGERFDNSYYENLINGKGVLRSDQQLTRSPDTVYEYTYDERRFFYEFGLAMVKMGNISPLLGTEGEIRKACRLVN